MKGNSQLDQTLQVLLFQTLSVTPDVFPNFVRVKEGFAIKQENPAPIAV